MKIGALQDMRLDPSQIHDPYDALTNSLQRWKNLATSKKMQTMTPDQKQTIARNYYRKMIVPQYQRMGSNPIKEQVWMDQAYSGALKWNIEEAYDSHWRSGFYQTASDFDNLINTGMSLLGGVIHDAISLRSPLGVPDIVEDIKNKGVFKHFHDEAETIPVLGATMKQMDRFISGDSFWHDINPNQHWGDGVQSFITEQALQLPLYMLTGGVTAGFLKGFETSAKLAPLLEKPAGYITAQLLLNGMENGAYGYAMRDPADKKDAWQDAIIGGVLGTVFNIRGNRFKNMTMEALKARQDAAMAAHDMRIANEAADLKGNTVASTAGVAAAGGRPATSAMINEAIAFVKNTSHLNREEYEQAVNNALKENKVRNQPITTMATYLIKYLDDHYGGRRIEYLKSEEIKEIETHLASIAEEAGDKVPAVVSAVTKKAGDDAVKFSKTNKIAQEAISKMAAEEHEKNMAEGMPDTPENKARAQKVAEKRYAKANAEAAQKAAEENSRKPVREVQEINERDVPPSFRETPPSVRLAKPHYGYQNKLFELDFEDPIDKIAYILSDKNGKEHKSIRESSWFIRQKLSDSDLAAIGQRVRDFIKTKARVGYPEEGPIKIPKRGRASPPPTIIQSTRRSVTKSGEPSVSFNTKHSWIVYARKAVKDSGNNWDSKGIKNWLDGLEPTDFSKDLYEHFFPKDLKNEGMFFERENVKSLGKEDPNFLAFMYNYTDQMPKEFAEELSHRLEDTMKFENRFDPKVDAELQKEVFAKNAWNHVAEFIHHPNYTQEGERNIYRTSYTTMDKPTKWDTQLLAETELNEQKMLKDMFKGKKDAHAAASVALNEAQAARRKAFKLKDPLTRQAAARRIDEVLTQTGHRERLNF